MGNKFRNLILFFSKFLKDGPTIIKIAAFYMATGTISPVVYIETSLGKFSFLLKFLKDGCVA